MKLHLPYHAEKSTVTVRNEPVEVKAYQIIVWVSLSLRQIMEWDPNNARIPAILDTGNTHNFAISEDQLKKWAGLHPESLPQRGTMREKGQRVALRSANVWLLTDLEPFRLDVGEGIGVYDEGGPRLPILGLRALTKNNLQTLIYGDQMRAVIQTPRKWYWPF